jgi:hypothetical protein
MTGHRPYDPRVSERMEEPRDPQAEPDPWKDGPRWSEPGGDPWVDSPTPSGGASFGAPAACPWCGTPATPDAHNCSSCGAALAQRESIGDLVVPGLTAVDPALKDYANRPLRLTGPSPSHGVASGAIAAAAAGGPAGLAIIGGVAAVAAVEYLGAGRRPDGQPAAEVGQASSAVLRAIEKLDRGEALPAADETTPRPELGTQAPGPGPAPEEETADGGD